MSTPPAVIAPAEDSTEVLHVTEKDEIHACAEVAGKNDESSDIKGDENQDKLSHSLSSHSSDEMCEVEDEIGASCVQTLSKKKQNKLRRKLGALKHRPEKRKRERERKKQNRQAARDRGEEVRSRKMLKRNAMKYSSCHVTVVIDGTFDEYMNDRGIMNYVKQIQYSYSANRRAENPLQCLNPKCLRGLKIAHVRLELRELYRGYQNPDLKCFYVAGVGEKSQKRLETVGVYKNWDVYFRDEAYYDLFDKEKIIYLSSDSNNVLKTLEEDKVYIIGGIVDYNHHKGLCHKLAVEKGIPHAQLPIADFVEMKTRKVLTVNQVFEILLKYTETKDWQKTISSVIPLRKGAVVKNTDVGDGLTGQQSEDSHSDWNTVTQADFISQDISKSLNDDIQRDKEDVCVLGNKNLEGRNVPDMDNVVLCNKNKQESDLRKMKDVDVSGMNIPDCDLSEMKDNVYRNNTNVNS